jgi:CYTH domain-containing protein
VAKEIERKFLVRGDSWRSGVARSTPYEQGYIPTDKSATVRVRIAGDHGFLTIKGPTVGMTRDEFEYEIPKPDARQMLDTLCGSTVAKVRHLFEHGGHTWEIDEFLGRNEGLIVAEIELESETARFDRPEWVGEEVTLDRRYFNASLAQAPYSTWGRPSTG